MAAGTTAATAVELVHQQQHRAQAEQDGGQQLAKARSVMHCRAVCKHQV